MERSLIVKVEVLAQIAESAAAHSRAGNLDSVRFELRGLALNLALALQDVGDHEVSAAIQKTLYRTSGLYVG